LTPPEDLQRWPRPGTTDGWSLAHQAGEGPAPVSRAQSPR